MNRRDVGGTLGPGQLADHWRSTAEVLREYGGVPQAVAIEHCADQLELALREQSRDELTLPEAAVESGYSGLVVGRASYGGASVWRQAGGGPPDAAGLSYRSYSSPRRLFVRY